jgi:hypothetical protein
MLKLQENELIQIFRQPGGTEFADFCAEIIRATCWAGGVPQSEIYFTARTDIKDGGVDARVASAVPNDKTGYFSVNSIWQFKAADEANISDADMLKEANKPFARSCIESGHAYRICICAHLPPDKHAALEDALTAAVANINASAPRPKVLSVGNVCALANLFPALVLRYRPGSDGICILFERWGQIITGVTPRFSPSSGFEPMKAAILNHSDFAKPSEDGVLVLHGQSGVGKTRTAFEAMREHPGAKSMVIYLDNEDHAGTWVNMLVNDPTAHLVLVVDECSLSKRVTLTRLLSEAKSRVRCICIDNSTDRPGTLAPEFTVGKPSLVEVQRILTDNFPQIPLERIRAYAQFSEGFVRLAADMCCYYDDRIQQAGNFGPIATKLEEYYRERLGTDDRLKAVNAIALLKRVRRKGEAPTELDHVCSLTGLDRETVEQNLAAIKDVPGFVERGELFYRVTPELIALIAFENAWKLWAERDPEAFLGKIPEPIQESFLERVSEGRNGEVRKIAQGFFHRMVQSFTARDLSDVRMVNKLVKFIETDAETYLPRLRETLESASHEELVGSATPDWLGGWGPRRELVWLAEKLVQFPEFFAECERILYVLAVHECEGRISNNATNIWQQLFRLRLSGTAVALEARLKVLGTRLRSATEQTATLFAGAISTILDFQASRLLGPPVVAGRIVPPEWYPSGTEFVPCVLSALRFIQDAMSHAVPALAKSAKETFLENIQLLTRQGWLEQIVPLVAQAQLDEDDRARLVGKVKRFLAWEQRPSGERRMTDAYALKVVKWTEELEPSSLHSRLIERVGAAPWDHYGRESEFETSLRVLARETLDSDALSNELDWLTSGEAQSAYNFGYAVGGQLEDAGLLELVLNRSVSRDAAFARGFISGLLAKSEIDTQPVNLLLDKWEAEQPAFCFQVALAGGNRVHVFERATRLVKANKIPAYHLRVFTHWVGQDRVTTEQVLMALRVLLPYSKGGDERCSDALMDFLAAKHHSHQLEDIIAVDPQLFWEAMAAFTQHPGRQESFWWGKILEAVGATEPKSSIHLACKALVSKEYALSDEASKLLTQMAPAFPDMVMSEIGSVMLDANLGIRFFLSKFSFFNALPFETVTAWLLRVGSAGAERIARHLPAPRIDGAGNPVVPDLTRWVLATFENDDRVFAEFCAGVHSFQTYLGDAALVHESEAEVARKFLTYPLRRIREWAQVEHESALREARLHREWDDLGR